MQLTTRFLRQFHKRNYIGIAYTWIIMQKKSCIASCALFQNIFLHKLILSQVKMTQLETHSLISFILMYAAVISKTKTKNA